MLLNCGVGEDSWESLGLQGDPTSPILKEISPGCSLKGLMLKLKLQYFGLLMRRADSLEKTLMMGKIEHNNRRFHFYFKRLSKQYINKPKNWRFRTVLLEKIPKSPLDSKESQPVHLKENQIWIFIGRTDAEAETPMLWPPYARNWLTGKDPDAGKDWRQEEKGMTEDEMVGWYHWFNGHELGQTLGDSEGQGKLAWCSPWGCKDSDMT